MDNKIKNIRLLEEAKKIGAIIGGYSLFSPITEKNEIVDKEEDFESIRSDIMEKGFQGNGFHKCMWVEHDKPFIQDIIELKKLREENIISEEEHQKLYGEKRDEMDWYGIRYNSEQREKRESKNKSKQEIDNLKNDINNLKYRKETTLNPEKMIKDISHSILAAATKSPITERIFYGKDGRPMRD